MATDFDTWLDDAWNRHASDPAGVAAALPHPGLALAGTASQVLDLAHLAQHVLGEHLGRWQAGVEMLGRIAALPTAPTDGPGAARLERYRRALAVCAAPPDSAASWSGLSAADRIGVAATAAALLAPHATPRARALMEQALSEATAAALPPGDPALRALAAGVNNVASSLEQVPGRTDAQRALMITAAEAARHWWAVAGTWLETERADYRLASVLLAAGEPVRAQVHAQACLDRVTGEGGGAPMERFYAWEVLGRVARARQDAGALATARTEAAAAFDALPESDRRACLPDLERLRAA